MLPKYSVLMSVYARDDAAWFEEAVESMARQTLRPDEIVIVEDGPVPAEIHTVEQTLQARYPDVMRFFALPKQSGLGEAMRFGVEQCRNEWIARMDADDFSEPNRCETELRMAEKMGADIVGCDCEEFEGNIENARSKRVFPEAHADIVRFSRRRTPFCHPAVMMKKSAVMKAGNYREVYLLEDYSLFVRMLQTGAVACSVKEILYHVRVSSDFYNRRSGMKYVKTLLAFNVHLLREGWMKPVDFFVRSCGNLLVGLAPTGVRSFIYRRLLRR